MTRQQHYLIAALTNVSAVKQAHDEKLDKAYGGLCHALPILVRNDGLAQAVAWIEEKAAANPTEATASELARAYAHQRDHITALLHPANDPPPLVEIVREASNTDYIRYTMLMLDAWVYYKRFASSMLGVDSSQESGDIEEATR